MLASSELEVTITSLFLHLRPSIAGGVYCFFFTRTALFTSMFAITV